MKDALGRKLIHFYPFFLFFYHFFKSKKSAFSFSPYWSAKNFARFFCIFLENKKKRCKKKGSPFFLWKNRKKKIRGCFYLGEKRKVLKVSVSKIYFWKVLAAQ
jgi:hypothetical protein